MSRSLPSALPLGLKAAVLGALALASCPEPYKPPTNTDEGPVNDKDGDGFSIADGDCDDEDDRFYPGANDIVGDDKDQNCDGLDGLDADLDGHASTGSGGDDCNDDDIAIYGGAPEVGWDGIDQDCDMEDRYDFLEVSGGRFHTCALDSTGTIRCWGGDARGQTSFRPLDADWKHVTSGEEFSCAVHEDGRACCWGSDEFRQIQDNPGGAQCADPSQAIPGDWDQISAGHEFACALNRQGYATCWGQDEHGQVSEAPTGVELQAIAAGGTHACAITASDGRILCWGRNDQGGPVDYVPQNSFDINYTRIVSGADYSCAIRQDQGLRCWGHNDVGQTSAPSDAGPYSLLAATDRTTCGILEAQTLSCWGLNNQYQVTDAPDNVSVHWVGLGFNHGCAIRNDNDHVICWGQNVDGQATPPWP